PQDLGIWSDDHIEPFVRITRFIHEQGSVAGIQLAHAGRKASTYRPSEKKQGTIPMAEGGWQPVAPSPMAFDQGYAVPEALTEDGIRAVVRAFADAAGRARQAGFRVVEIHAAHGYLLHQFLSPFSNKRTDHYGGSFENRTRLVREVAAAIRKKWPERFPLLIRISATDWAEGGWDIEQSVELVRQLRPLGVDLIDCSSGGSVPSARMPIGPGYQTPFAERIRRETGVATGAVGMITSCTGRSHHPHWPSRYCALGSRVVARPLLAFARGARTGPEVYLACAVFARRAGRLAGAYCNAFR